MEKFNKNEWYQKTNEYIDYIEQHKANVKRAWKDIQNARLYIPSLILQSELYDGLMDERIEHHDDSKFSEEEFLPYRQHFYPIESEQSNNADFEKAWQHHYKNNDHHWQYWINEDGSFIEPEHMCIKMSAYLEMICDWQAMSYVFGGSALQYYQKNKDKIQIDPLYVKHVEKILEEYEEYLQHKKVADDEPKTTKEIY